MFNHITITELQKYIGKNIVIYNSGIEPDPYFGNQDVSPAYFEQKTIAEFLILKDTVIIKTKDHKEYDIKDIRLYMNFKNMIY